ncbi:hypothetical protein [Hyphomicrobium sp. 2TAF46]|uniref:hypothetical protein n=1 Tax=Hyphomicrobium sp. 2TAF46 TaxID=3233019 RepID=UPI003F9306D1
MTVKAFVWWSIYVRSTNPRKLKEVHLPPIEAALDGTQFGWQSVVEDENTTLTRFINYQNLEGATVTDVVTPVLRRAYRLANGWTIHGLFDLNLDELHSVIGGWNSKKASRWPPALESMMFEISPGEISGMGEDGGREIAGEPGRTLRVPSKLGLKP